MKLLDTTPHLYDPRRADELAAAMNQSDDWTYRVTHDHRGTGASHIDIYDESGAFVGRL